MITPTALAKIDNEITPSMVEYAAPIVAELIDYIRWLADQDSSLPLTAGHIWILYHEGVVVGRVWSDICEDIGLPIRKDWY